MFRDKNIWVNWKKELRDGKYTKVPYTPTGAHARSNDPNTWSSFEDVVKALRNKKNGFTGIGFQFHPDLRIVGIDFDNCFNEKEEFTNPLFEKLYKSAKTYSEKSPSGKGLHIILQTDEAFIPKRNKAPKECPGFEIYTHGRFFTYTNKRYGSIQKVRTITIKEAEKLLSIVGYPWEQVKEEKKAERIPIDITDDQLLQKIFSGKNGPKVKRLYDGDISDHGKDESSADAALCTHFAFWTGKDHEWIRRLWLSSPLGAREKTQKRKDYQDRTIKNAIRICNESYSAPSVSKEAGDEGKSAYKKMILDSKGKPYVNTYNVAVIIRSDPKLNKAFRYNEFINSAETNIGGDRWRAIQEEDILMALSHIQHSYAFFERVQKAMVADSIILCSKDFSVNPPKDYIKSLEWDKTPRLDEWLHKTYGTPNDVLHQKMGANWLKGLVKRIIEPGCKFDYVLVLEGPQGWFKSTSLSVLGSPWHVETVMSTDSKDFFMLLSRNAIVEFSEGETLSRSEVKRLKSIITTLEDEYRKPYGRDIERSPRHCVFAMTTNQDEYLKDETGNRRWLPVKCINPADLKWLGENRDQLYAEAYHRVIKKKETTWDFPEEEIIALQQSRVIGDPYEEALFDWYAFKSQSLRDEGVTTLEAFQVVYTGNAAFGREMTRATAMTISAAFRRVLFLEQRRTMLNGSRAWRWFPTEQTQKEIPITLGENLEEKKEEQKSAFNRNF